MQHTAHTAPAPAPASAPVAAQASAPAPTSGPALAASLRTGTERPARPRWWTELPLIVAVYAAYSAGRLLAGGDLSTAVGHGMAILRLEGLLHLRAELPLNRLFARQAWLGISADFTYATLHFVVTPRSWSGCGGAAPVTTARRAPG